MTETESQQFPTDTMHAVHKALVILLLQAFFIVSIQLVGWCKAEHDTMSLVSSCFLECFISTMEMIQYTQYSKIVSKPVTT